MDFGSHFGSDFNSHVVGGYRQYGSDNRSDQFQRRASESRWNNIPRSSFPLPVARSCGLPTSTVNNLTSEPPVSVSGRLPEAHAPMVTFDPLPNRKTGSPISPEELVVNAIMPASGNTSRSLCLPPGLQWCPLPTPLPSPELAIGHSPIVAEDIRAQPKVTASNIIAKYLVDGECQEIEHLDKCVWGEFFSTVHFIEDRHHPLYRIRYSYNADTSTLIVKCMPSSVHQAFHGYFNTVLPNILANNNISNNNFYRFEVTAETELSNFGGRYEGSVKLPDMMISPVAPRRKRKLLNGGFPSLAVEIGFSQSYDGLVKDMELWLCGSGEKVNVVIIINLTEEPKPTLQALIHDEEFDPGPMSTPSDESEWDNPDNDFGPLHRNGHLIVGKLSGILEVWRLGENGNPFKEVSKTVLPEPVEITPEDDSFSITMIDLFGFEDNIPAGHTADERLTFPLPSYRDALGRGLESLAMSRLNSIRDSRRKLAGDDGEAPVGDDESDDDDG